ncbi:MAG TPA: D-alanine--D-alanine ligase [Flavobacteriaceae bacterium]|nr:D-alanine--D-alanine ligase [Flavobacteriaceae bacterium]
MRKNIAILMGGYSNEYKISLKSGKVVFETLKNSNFNCFQIHILTDRWVYVDESKKEFMIDKDSFTIIEKPEIKFDCAFNAIHGSPGEDGLLHEYFSKLNIPMSGCGEFQARLTFDKIKCLEYLKPHGIKCAKSSIVSKGDKINSASIIKEVGLPCFVKASKSGSSYGITKVVRTEDFDNAMDIAFNEDSQAIVESFLDGVEVSVGVISYENDILALPITEIVTNNEFFDYNAKYKGEADEITPARISNQMTLRIKSIAKKIYEILDMKGFSRSEFIIVNDEVFLLEVNSVPGLTNESILPKQANAAGIELIDLFSNAINEAIN